MTQQEKIAAALLAMYFTGAGDAGCENAFFTLHKILPLTEKDVKQTLLDGEACQFQYNGKMITQSAYCMILASLILEDLSK